MAKQLPYQILHDSNGVTDTPGFAAAGTACGIRETGKARLDLALLHSSLPCAAAGVFTRNAVQAAPVRVCRETLDKKTPAHGIVANSGNANACTGPRGTRDARQMRALAAQACGAMPEQFLVCSTGRIGRPLPMEKIRQGIWKAAREKDSSPRQGRRAARAILTSDTREKRAAARLPFKQGTVTVAGMAKGAGMIHPGMATMLAFLTTDAGISPSLLRNVLRRAVRHSFNAITVDGDMSTNDTVLFLANGASGIKITPGRDRFLAAFQEAANYVCMDLAEKIAGDGEKITRTVEVRVEGARTEKEAERVARAAGNSLLVKSSWFGADPNWGRLLGAAGYAGVPFAEDEIELFYQPRPAGRVKPVPVFRKGRPCLRYEKKWKAIVSAKSFTVLFHLHRGGESFRLLSTDLTAGYVHFNKSE